MQKQILALMASAAIFAGPAAAGGKGGDWSGLYVGFHLGGSEMSADTSRTIDTNAYWLAINQAQVEAVSAIDFEEQGFTGGFQIGYNHMWDWLLIGIEADASFNALNASNAQVVPYASDPTLSFQTVTSIDQDWLGTLRARLGFDLEGALLYATGGAAFGNVQFTQGFSDTAVVPYSELTEDEIRTGWSAGGGVEIGAFAGTTFRVEYLHTDLGTSRLTGQPLSGNPGTVQTGRAEITLDTIRMGMNWPLN
jgi:outer membrane immunogenic protein